ncbi:MAG: pyridoxamine 5'-phosphate oxidase family protein [Acidobacteria bacterium]|nr:pyridoxamine 5'-phosphate oxidase family protein [Acidobacteriota bacterium]
MTQIYHEGELGVQARSGVQELASRVGKSIRSFMPLAAQEFLSSLPMAVLASVDRQGQVWASLLTGEAGFMQAVDGRTVRIDAPPVGGDPLRENLVVNNQVGMIAIEFSTRRRMRINGTAEIGRDSAIYIHAIQVYSNCPKYIQARAWQVEDGETPVAGEVRRTTELTEPQRVWIESADTFFIASHHGEGGADASHRGGNPGFVRVLDKGALVFPDYAGNTMFQTLGNLALNPNCGLLFIDFERGETLQLTGTAQIIWDSERLAEFAGAERAVEFRIAEAIEIFGSIRLNWQFMDYSPFNPKSSLETAF